MISEQLVISNNDIFDDECVNDESCLREDMYQATYQNYCIDSGWYRKHFITYLIKDSNWEEPILRIESRPVSDARWSIAVCIQYLEMILR